MKTHFALAAVLCAGVIPTNSGAATVSVSYNPAGYNQQISGGNTNWSDSIDTRSILPIGSAAINSASIQFTFTDNAPWLSTSTQTGYVPDNGGNPVYEPWGESFTGTNTITTTHWRNPTAATLGIATASQLIQFNNPSVSSWQETGNELSGPYFIGYYDGLPVMQYNRYIDNSYLNNGGDIFSGQISLSAGDLAQLSTTGLLPFSITSTNYAALASLQVTMNTTPVPEPESYAMMLAGLGLVGGLACRRQSIARSTSQPA